MTTPCVITVYGIEIDVVDIYRSKGFDTLPSQLTLSGHELYRLGNIPCNYSIVKNSDSPLNFIPANQSIIVKDGDEFFAVPPATY